VPLSVMRSRRLLDLRRETSPRRHDNRAKSTRTFTAVPCCSAAALSRLVARKLAVDMTEVILAAVTEAHGYTFGVKGWVRDKTAVMD
jgi:hypothetical protein